MAITDRSIVQLIGSMGRTEKAHFKKFGFKRQTDGQQNMLDMFDAIDRLLNKQLEDKQLDKQVNDAWDKAGISNRALIRNRLFHALLDSLRDHHRQRSAEEEMMRTYRTAQLLIARGLMTEADSMLVKAIQKAEKLQLNEFVMLLLKQRHFVLHAQNQRKEILENLGQRQKLAEEMTSHMLLGSLYEQTYQLQVSSGQEGNNHKLDELSLIDEAVSQINLQEEDTKGQILKLNILHTISFDSQDYERAKVFSAQTLDVVEADPKYLERNSRAYLMMLYNHLNDLINIKDIDAFNKQYPKMTALAVDPDLKSMIEDFSVSILLDFMLNSEDLSNFEEFEEQYLIWRKKGLPNMQINKKLDRLSRTTALYYLNNDLDTSLDLIQEFMQAGKRGIRADLDLKMAVLQIMIQIELGQIELAQYQLRSLTNRAKQQDLFRTQQNEFIKLLGKILSPTRTVNINELANDYLNQMNGKPVPFSDIKANIFLARAQQRKSYL